MNHFETVPSHSDRAHLDAASREPEMHAALLRHLIEVQASAQALSKWETRAAAPAPLAATLPKPRSARASVRND